MKRQLTQKERARVLWLAVACSLALVLLLSPSPRSLEDSLTEIQTLENTGVTTLQLQEDLDQTTVLLSSNQRGILLSAHRFSSHKGWTPKEALFLPCSQEGPPVWAGYTNAPIWEGALVFGAADLEEAVSFRACEATTDHGGRVHPCDDTLIGPIQRGRDGRCYFLAWAPFGEDGSVLWFQTLELLDENGQVLYTGPLPQQ